MIEYLITPLLPGTTRAEIVQFFNNKEHPFLVSSAVGDITGFMHDFEASTAVCSNQGLPLETKRSTAEHGIIKGPQRLVVGQDIGGQSMCSGPNSFVIQRASNLFRPFGGSAVGCNSSLLQREPRALNAVDILRETASGDSPSIADSPGIPNALDYVVKKEEEPQDTNPLFSQDPSRPQPTQSLFSRGTHAEALMEEDPTVATERVFKEEVDDEQFDDTEDHEKDGEKTKEAHQCASAVDPSLNGLQDDGLIKCDVCNAIVTISSFFLDHISTHPECKVCRTRFRSLEDLVSHRSLAHKDLIQCDICGKCLATKGGLAYHRRTHKKQLECEVCRKLFTGSSDLMAHLLTHTDKKWHECTECRTKFSDVDSLKLHYLRSHGSQPTKNIPITRLEEESLKCEVCQKRFDRHSTLMTHFRTHTGQKPFECTACHKKFSHKCNLTRHFRMHTGAWPFKCTECQMRFKHSCDLLCHRRSRHGFEKPSD